MPEILPLDAIVAIAVLLLSHVPPGVPLDVKVTAPVSHIMDTPEILPALGSGFTVTIATTVFPDKV